MTGRLADLMRVVDSLVRAPDAEARLGRDPRGFLRDAGLSEADVEATAAIDPRRLLLYRKLVRRGVTAAVREEIPRAAARLGSTFDDLAARFVEHGVRSRYLRDAAFEFVAFASPLLAADPGVPAYVVELARHELSAFESGGAADVEAGATFDEVALDRPAAMHPSARLHRYRFAVHELAEDVAARDVPREEPTLLFAYRDSGDEVRWLKLDALGADVVEGLIAGATLQAAIERACAARGVAVDASSLGAIGVLLEDLGARGALLGAAPLEERRA